MNLYIKNIRKIEKLSKVKEMEKFFYEKNKTLNLKY